MTQFDIYAAFVAIFGLTALALIMLVRAVHMVYVGFIFQGWGAHRIELRTVVLAVCALGVFMLGQQFPTERAAARVTVESIRAALHR